MDTPITVTRTETEYIDFDELTKCVENAIFKYGVAEDLEQIISEVLDDCFFNYDWYNDEIREWYSIVLYVENHLSEKALKRLDY